jgi:hypothetical protein
VPTFDIQRQHFDFCVQGLQETNRLFEYFKQRKQIDTVIHYEDWQDDVDKILPLLGYPTQSVETFKKIKYTLGHKSNLVNNLEQVMSWMQDPDVFEYKYKL